MGLPQLYWEAASKLRHSALVSAWATMQLCLCLAMAHTDPTPIHILDFPAWPHLLHRYGLAWQITRPLTDPSYSHQIWSWSTDFSSRFDLKLTLSLWTCQVITGLLDGQGYCYQACPSHLAHVVAAPFLGRSLPLPALLPLDHLPLQNSLPSLLPGNAHPNWWETPFCKTHFLNTVLLSHSQKERMLQTLKGFGHNSLASIQLLVHVSTL